MLCCNCSCFYYGCGYYYCYYYYYYYYYYYDYYALQATIASKLRRPSLLLLELGQEANVGRLSGEFPLSG